MTIYIDTFNKINDHKRHCHLWGTDVQELHNFAVACELKREWFQDHRIPHYDIFSYRIRSMAIKHGAIPVTTRRLMQHIKEARDADEM